MLSRSNYGGQGNGYPMPGMVDRSFDNSQMMLNADNNVSMDGSMHFNNQSGMYNQNNGGYFPNSGMKSNGGNNYNHHESGKMGLSSNHADNSLNISNKPFIQGKPVMKKGQNMVVMPIAKKGGLEKLRELPRIFVKQKFEMLEMLTGCETENRYKVYAADENMERVGEPIFKCKEKSNFFARNCLSGDCRPFQMRVIHEDVEDDDDDDLFLFLDRPCKCTFYCLNRPEITVTLKEHGHDRYIGKVVSQWACCDMLFDILDRDDQVIYKINGSCCQWGLFCNCPCEACAKIEFQIRTVDGQPIGEIFKLYSGVMKELFTDTDNFCCVFPENATPEHKALLLASVLFIDFRYFEMAPQQGNIA